LISAVDYLQAQQIRKAIKEDFVRVFKDVDLLVTPTLPILPNHIGDKYVHMDGIKDELYAVMMRLVCPCNLAGLPSLSIPNGFIDGLPVGMQLIGGAFKEENILKAGYAFEKASSIKTNNVKLFNE